MKTGLHWSQLDDKSTSPRASVAFTVSTSFLGREASQRPVEAAANRKRRPSRNGHNTATGAVNSNLENNECGINPSRTCCSYRSTSEFVGVFLVTAWAELTCTCQPLLNATYPGHKISLPFQPKRGCTLHSWKRKEGPRHDRHQRIYRVNGGSA